MISNVEVRLTVPEITLAPTVTSCGNDSPVNAFVSSVDVPEIITPSSGIFSPGFTIKISSLFLLL